MTSSFGLRLSRATILRASSNGHAFDCSATSRIDGMASAMDIWRSRRRQLMNRTTPRQLSGSQARWEPRLHPGLRRLRLMQRGLTRRTRAQARPENAERDGPRHVLRKAGVPGLGTLKLVGEKPAAAA